MHEFSGTGLLSTIADVGVIKTNARQAQDYFVGSVHVEMWGWP